MDFNKQRMLDNISFLLKEKKKKIGELESECGVSAGYISRSAKDNAAKPGIDFVVNAANALGVTVDTLINYDLSSLTPTERYLIAFIEKLKKDTDDDKLEWKKNYAENLNNLEPDRDGYVSHPLFNLETITMDGDPYPIEEQIVVFCSVSFGYATRIADNCFSLKMKNKSTLYLMSLKKESRRNDEPTKYAYELWLHKPSVGAEYLCGSRGDSVLSQLVTDLYEVVSVYSRHPLIDKRLRSVIDAFMVDDLEDSSDDPFGEFASSDDLPF